MSEDSSHGDPQLRDLPLEWWAYMKVEWRQRTAFGKLLYPVWFVWSAMQWSVALAFMGLMWGLKQIDESAETKTVPDEWVYKDE